LREIFQDVNFWTAVATIFLVVVTFLLVIATGVIAYFTWRAAEATKRGVQAQVVIELLKEYAQEDLAADVSALQTWGKQNDEEILRALNVAKNMEDLDQRFEFLDHGQTGVDLNSARRNVSHYFQKVHRLYKGKLITEEIIRLILDEEQVLMWRDCVEPMEWLLKYPKTYAREQFDELDKIYKVGRRVISGLAGWDEGKYPSHKRT